MPFDGNGNFVPLPIPNFPAEPGTVIYAARYNANMLDLMGGLSNALTRDGQAGMQANLPMGGWRLTNLAAGNATGHAVEYQQWQGSFFAPAFQAPTTLTPPITDNSERIPNTQWVQKLINNAASINLPPILGKNGSLQTNGTTIFWAPIAPDFLLLNAGVF